MSSSIRCGLNALLQAEPSLEAAIFMVCDQPYVSADLLKKLIEKRGETNKPIVASTYRDTIGTPVLFEKIFFPELFALKGQSGAKKIIGENMRSVLTVSFPMGFIDIDTKDDCETLQKNQSDN